MAPYSIQWSFKVIITLWCLLIGRQCGIGQTTDTLFFQLSASIAYPPFFSAYSGVFHPNGSFLYTANKELGLVAYELTNDNNLLANDTLANSHFNNNKITNLDYDDGYLYAALGDFQAIGSRPGLAIMEVSENGSLQVISVWDTAVYHNGSAIVKVQGNYAYLGAMDDGLLIINIEDKSHPYLMSRLLPDVNFPDPPGLFSYPHARGLAIKDDFVFLCNDAGGFRVINVGNKAAPVEIARYVNTVIENTAASAYNNVVINGDYAYIAVDYCGIEVLNIADPAQPAFVSLYNPWNCNTGNWEDGPGHANELALTGQNLLFASAGDSELLALDISNPELLVPIGAYGMPYDSAAVWGFAASDHKAALFYINNSSVPAWIPQPFYSNFGGVRLLEWQRVSTPAHSPEEQMPLPLIFPNPFNEALTVKTENGSPDKPCLIEVYNAQGQLIYRQTIATSLIELNTNNWPSGIYCITAYSANTTCRSTLAIKSTSR